MSYIIMKYDDLSVEALPDFSRVADFAIEQRLPISMGIIGSSLLGNNDVYFATCKNWMDNNIELWNHGYFHTLEEFSVSSFEEQCYSISETQKLMLEKLGKAAVTFGSPHNNSTEITIKALQKCALEIQNYLFAVDGAGSMNMKQVLVRCNMETSPGNIDFDFFKENYELIKDLPYMMIQGHPSLWQEKDFKLNEDILLFLKAEGNVLVTPIELVDIVFNTEFKIKLERELEPFIKLIEKNKDNFMLYGAGQIGREFFRFLKLRYGMEPRGFIVSDGQRIQEEMVCNTPVISYTTFLKDGRDSLVIPALMPNFHQELIKLFEADNVKYFRPQTELAYLRMINIIRFLLF